MIQQKEGTDSRYRFPDEDPEPLELGGAPLTAAQRELAAVIERRLAGSERLTPYGPRSTVHSIPAETAALRQ